jgi:hypothetical protein
MVNPPPPLFRYMYAQMRLSDESLTKYLAFLWVKLVRAGIIHYTHFCLIERSVFSLLLFPKLFYLIAYETAIYPYTVLHETVKESLAHPQQKNML